MAEKKRLSDLTVTVHNELSKWEEISSECLKHLNDAVNHKLRVIEARDDEFVDEDEITSKVEIVVSVLLKGKDQLSKCSQRLSLASESIERLKGLAHPPELEWHLQRISEISQIVASEKQEEIRLREAILTEFATADNCDLLVTLLAGWSHEPYSGQASSHLLSLWISQLSSNST